MSDEIPDPIRRLRAELTELDEHLVETMNQRLELVLELRRVKQEHGLDFLDPARERWLQSHLGAANRGPLSSEGLRELVAELLALTKREVGRND
ncbi:MAG: chorismate mutase [Gaiellaceae bacterium MAG52_C11]|nr:chorismate mutase [Candidatus Gaiellasilicea maunaloa]